MRSTRVPISPRVQELKKQKKKVRQKRTLLRVVLCVILLGSILLLINISQLQISNVRVSSHLKDNEQISSYINEQISNKLLFVIPKRSIIFFSKKGLSRNLISKFPILENISLEINDRELVVEGQERTPEFLYCGSEPNPLGFGIDACELVDRGGFDFRKAPIFSGPVYFTFYISGATPSLLGKQILPTEKFTKLSVFKDGLKDININPTGIIVGSDETLTLLISKKGGTSYGKIIFLKTQDVSSLLNDLKLILQNEPLKSHILHPETIDYIDIRYKDKVYYKFK